MEQQRFSGRNTEGQNIKNCSKRLTKCTSQNLRMCYLIFITLRFGPLDERCKQCDASESFLLKQVSVFAVQNNMSLNKGLN